jgi:predicted transcriptional regulator of viral defense system
MDVDIPRLYLRSELRAAGVTDSELRRQRRAGVLHLVRRGAYVHTDQADLREREVAHALAIRAQLPRLAGSAVVSHGSAALVHGLPVWGLPLSRVHVTRARRTGGRVGAAVHVHTAPLRPDEIEVVDGIAVTALARTVVDVARTSGFEAAVAVADAALRAGLCGEEVADAVARTGRWPGCAAARRVLAFADGRSESVGESRSRIVLDRAGLRPPVLQWKVWRGRVLVGQCDFAWPEAGVVGEFDGKVKYGRLLKPGDDPGDVVYREKLREDALRAEGLTVVRWIWRDLRAFDRTAARIRRSVHG